MPARMLRLSFLLALLLGQTALAQVFVYPRRAFQSHVRYFDFQWKHLDIDVGPQLPNAPGITQWQNPGFPEGLPPIEPRKPGPFARSLEEQRGVVRLYFYDREERIAQRAAASIVDSYRELVEHFEYVPTERFPYILYNSYQEFLQTNLFPLQEGVLGVTSPQDLKLTLPYLGDHRQFQEVSAHEMAHQFTIQKIRSYAQDVPGDPLGDLPLWFIEGLAEYYAQGGLEQEAEMLVRDLLINPDLEQGYALLDFFEDRPYSVLWTYKGGNVRCAFLEEVYGRGTLQRILEGIVKHSPSSRFRATQVFPRVVQGVTGDDPEKLSRRFETWLKRREYQTYLHSEQDAPTFTPLLRSDRSSLLHGLVSAMQSSPGGDVLMLRSLNIDTGDSRLLLVHRFAPDDPIKVAEDGVPGIESLHPIGRRNFDLTRDKLAFIAESQARDVIYLQDYEVRMLDPPPPLEGEPPLEQPTRRASLDLKGRRALRLGKHGILAAYSPAFSPDGTQLAFIGMTIEGIRDVYVLSIDGDGAPQRLTDDDASERQLSWGPDGIVFTSDATSHRRYNLFRVRPEQPKQVQRLSFDSFDQNDPEALPDGRVLFSAYQGGRSNLYELVQGRSVQRTDVPTGLFDVSPGPRGGVWALFHEGGQRRPVFVSRAHWIDPPPLEPPPAVPPVDRPTLSLDGAEPYRPFRVENWELGPIFALLGAGNGIVGRAVASANDRLVNHALLLDVGIFGSFELTDGFLLYINQEGRVTWGGGPFQALSFRRDQTFPDLPEFIFSGERYFGALGSIRYPFNRFVYVQTDLSIGGASYFLPAADATILAFPELNSSGQDLYGAWLTANTGTRLQTEATLRLGYDTTRYHPATGPITGTSLLLETTATWQPVHQETFGQVRFDGERHFSLFGRTNFFLRGGAGTSLGGRLAREYFLSSFDTLRGVRFGDLRRLLGSEYFFSTAELQFPLNELIRVFILSDLEGILGFDFGGVGGGWRGVWDNRVLNFAVGSNFGVGPLLFRLHFAKNIGIGAPAGLPVAPSEWVTNFSIGIAGFGGLFGHEAHGFGPTRRSPVMGP